ncbi:hypothetical protein HA402_016070 [Bradysia odoriphaga]|nr:hypothetical protein HA402_016070 [Bradysia odoriphaga]
MSTNTDDDHNEKNETKLSTPWLSILTSIPFFALTLTQAAQMWGYWTLMTKTPAYMKNILKFELKENALLSALPYLAKLVMSFVLSVLAQFLQRRQLFSLNFSRKFFNSIGQWIPAVLLIGFSYVSHENAEVAVSLLTIAVGINAAPYLGYQVNHIDLAPNYAGTLMGITNGVANIFSIVAPLIVGFIVTDETNPNQWRIIFFIAAGVYFIGNLMFVIFGRVTTQPWNDPRGNKSTGEISSLNNYGRQNETALKM